MIDQLFREAILESAGLDVAAGTARLSFSSELPVLRRNHPKYGDFYEVLSHAPGDCNLGLLNRSGVVLANHNDKSEIGVVVSGSAAVGSDRKCRAEIKLDREWRPYLQRLADGAAPNQVSVGYTLLSVLKREQNADSIPTIYFSWQPYEISILTAEHQPADPGVGLGRSLSTNNMTILDDAVRLALSGSRHNPDYSGFSLQEALNFEREPKGFTREACSESPKRIGGDYISDRFIPFAALAPQRRDLTVGGIGGELVVPDVQPIVSVLKNRCAAVTLGAVTVQGLEGDFQLPQATSAPLPQSLTETAQAALSNLTMTDRVLKPKRISIPLVVSKQLLIQNPGIEAFLRAEILAQIAVRIDRLIFFGNGAAQVAGEPLGLFNSAGIGSVIFGGNYWGGVTAMEKALTDANSDQGRLGFAISSATRNKWKQVSRLGATNYPSFVMEGGRVNDYPAAVTNNLADTNQAIFGNWSDLLLLFWGDGFEVINNPYSLDTTAQVRITVHCWFNLVPRHIQSFCVSADSGAV